MAAEKKDETRARGNDKIKSIVLLREVGSGTFMAFVYIRRL